MIARVDVASGGLTAPAPFAALERRSLADIAAVVVLVFVPLLALATFRDYGLGWDDFTHAQYGDLLLSLYGSGFTDRRALSFVNLYMYGGGFDMLAALAAKVLPFDLFETRRLVGALVGWAGLIITWRIARRLGGPLAGLLALLLLLLCPLYYGHTFMNPKDVPFAVSMALLLLAFVRCLDEDLQPQPATVAMFGIALGLAFGTRILAVLAAPAFLAALVLYLAHDARAHSVAHAARKFGRFLVALVPGFLLAYAVMALVWPWSVVDPLNPIKAVSYFSVFFEKPWREMFEGAAVSVPDMPRSYLPRLLLLKLPEVFVLFGIAGGIVTTVLALRSERRVRHRAAMLMLVVAALLPVALAVIQRPAMYNGIRHFIFIIPPLAMIAGIGAAHLFDRMRQTERPWMLRAAAIVTAIGFLGPVIEMVRLHPYQYTHFNYVSGGIRDADRRYMLDYWGLAFKQAGQELREKLTERLDTPPANRPWRIAVCGPHPAAQVELGPEFKPTWDSKGADFAMMLGEFYCAELNAPVLVEVEREGVIFARVYDIRGRSISSLFTIPPP